MRLQSDPTWLPNMIEEVLRAGADAHHAHGITVDPQVVVLVAVVGRPRSFLLTHFSFFCRSVRALPCLLVVATDAEADSSLAGCGQ